MILNRNRYDYSEFINIFENMLVNGRCNSSMTRALKNELNRFFKDSKCMNVYFTENTDNMFFGMKVYGDVDGDKIYDYLTSDTPVRLFKYVIELDSKLLNPVLGLTAREMTSFLLHEVGHIINDSAPIDDVRNVLDQYLTANNETLKMSDSIHYKEILTFGVKDYISKRASIMYNPFDDELAADEFAHSCGFADDLDTGLAKICRNNMKMYDNTDVSKTTVFFWTLRLYRHVGTRRISALHALSKAKRTVASRIERTEIENLIRRINRVDDEDVYTESVILESISSKMRKVRNNVRSITDEYYELSMRARNVRDEDDALYLMRRLNNYIGILDDYITSTKYMDDDTRAEWQRTLDKFKELREQLGKKCTYRVSSDFAIYVNYPDVFTDSKR